MKKRYYTSSEVRDLLETVLRSHTQAEIARECGVKPQNLSVMAKGAPINGKVLTWLGYRRVDDLYERVEP